jgi:CRP/FNR family transcriptional regulator, cyclic AMP receptor protein
MAIATVTKTGKSREIAIHDTTRSKTLLYAPPSAKGALAETRGPVFGSVRVNTVEVDSVVGTSWRYSLTLKPRCLTNRLDYAATGNAISEKLSVTTVICSAALFAYHKKMYLDVEDVESELGETLDRERHREEHVVIKSSVEFEMLNMKRVDNKRYDFEKTDYFSVIGKDLTDKLLKSKSVRCYAKGEVVSQSFEPLNNIFLIHSGLVKILTFLMDGREFVIDTPMAGNVFGEIDVITRSRAAFEVHALTACEVWALDAKIVRDSIATDHEVCANLLYYTVTRVKELEDRLIRLTAVGIPCRLANALLRLSAVENQCGRADNVINISQHELASMLPASREKVNRCLREWERGQIVNLAPGTITITNPRALHEYASH